MGREQTQITEINCILESNMLLFICLFVFLFHKNNSLVSQIQNESPVLANGAAKAVYAVYEAVTHDLLSSDLRYLYIYLFWAGVWASLLLYYCIWNMIIHNLVLINCYREQLDTWNILARARNERRLFSRIEWPKDPEIVSTCE